MEEKLLLILIYGSYFVTTVLLSFLINGLFLKFASTLGTRNTPENLIRWSPQAKPSLGGISFFILFLLSIASYSILFGHQAALFNRQLFGILAASTLAFLMGLSDDAYNTTPLLKLAIQICCALILILTGTHISLFSSIMLDYAITLFWVVAIMNSINMLDNMDAITTIISITIIMNALLILFLNNDGNNIHIIILIGVMSSLIGFLFFNWHPAKIFMGDTGSQFLGLFLAAMGIIYFWNTPDKHGDLIQSKQFFVTLLAFAIPIIDTTSVVINRILSGKSPFVGGKDHTTHSLFFSGMSEKRIAILYASICIVSMFFNFLIINFIVDWGYLHIILFSIYFLALFWFLYSPTIKYGRGN
jgi:UDP-GlcNAc:undecaprenyl-phosphate/decaprenyl-phosphate GlcNAc-1-phosphate transferase